MALLVDFRFSAHIGFWHLNSNPVELAITEKAMLSSPLITITTAQPTSPADHSVIWSLIITQLVALLIFGVTAYLSRRSDRDKRARDTKRDVLLEVAPAIQRIYTSLAELTNPSIPVDRVAERLTNAFGAVAKLQAVADDETLEAARKLMTALGRTMIRMMAMRVDTGTDIEATKQLIAFWRKETKDYPDLLANFSSKARSEIPLPLNKNKFRAGIEASNQVMSAEMDNLFESLAKQERGESRESQAGRATADIGHAIKEQNAATVGGISINDATQLTPEQATNISAQFIGLRQQATFWEYRYLNYFLVNRTQQALNWLIDRQRQGKSTTYQYYDAELAARVVAPAERAAVLQALEAHTLIKVDNGLLVVTEKGFDYASWRGPIPEPEKIC